MRYRITASPVGPLLIAGEDDAVSRISFHPFEPERSWERDDQGFAQVVAQLAEYFEGRRREFELPLAPSGTPFQRAVWKELQRIPFGETRSYGQVAAAIGRTSAVRAVGAANGANPLPIVVPCHRVIGANGSLTGFGGGLDAKKLLLDLERGAQRLW